MCANIIPAATLVSVAVFTDEEIITDVPPASIIHMEVLVRSNDRGARLLVPTVLTYTAMMDHHIRGWCHRQYLKVEALPGPPFASTDDSRTLWDSQKSSVTLNNIFSNFILQKLNMSIEEILNDLHVNWLNAIFIKFLSINNWEKEIFRADFKRAPLQNKIHSRDLNISFEIYESANKLVNTFSTISYAIANVLPLIIK